MAILVSGGAGYIGSHTCIELLNAGYDVVVADNYYNASPVVLDRIKQITGKDFRFYKADMTKHEDVEHIFSECPDITAVIQFAAYKAVGESVSKPIEYYYNNLNCTLVILDVMRHHNCHNFVFSSSATVYGDPASVPITEDFPTGATTNPYGTTKVFTERILQDVCKADPSLNVALLRYFNPIGAHKSGLIGEDPNGIPNNLMPYIAKVAVGKLEKVHVFGNDYPTPDGTGVRDYIHVVDLARGYRPTLMLTALFALFALVPAKVDGEWQLGEVNSQPLFWARFAMGMINLLVFWLIWRGAKPGGVFPRRLLAGVLGMACAAAALALFFYGGNAMWVNVLSMVLFGIAIGVLICFLGGLMAVDIVPRKATGAALGVGGMTSYIAAGIQDVASGGLIDSNITVAADGVKHYDFGPVAIFWLAAAVISFLLPLLNRGKVKEF